jgi:hypothetical protein
MASVRLDTRTEATLKRLSARRGQTKSEVIRDAITRLAEEDKEQPSAYERFRPYIGVFEGGDPQLSRETGKRFRELLENRERARRSD